jgi:hypothetical protein
LYHHYTNLNALAPAFKGKDPIVAVVKLILFGRTQV